MKLDKNNAITVMKKPIPIKYVVAALNGKMKTNEGDASYKKGDYIVTGVEDESWPISKKKFESTYKIINKTAAVKKPVSVLAKQMNKGFSVVTPSGNKLSGKAGDYIIQYAKNDQGVVSKSIFEKSYKTINETVTAGVALASHSPSDGASPAAPNGKAFGVPYFDVDADTFSKARLGRKKGKHWNSLMGSSSTVDAIRAYAKAKGNPDIMLRHPEGIFMYAQKGVKKNG